MTALQVPDEERVSRYFERFVDRPAGQVAFALRHPGETVAALRAVRRLPRLDLRLSDELQAHGILDQLDRTWLRRHLLAGVTAALTLPTDPDEYLRGSSKSKWSLRRRSREARELGVRILRVDDPAARAALAATATEHERVGPREEHRVEQPDNRDLPGHRFWFVAVHEDRPILLAVLPAEGEWAALRYFRVLETTEAATAARWLMMAEVVRALVESGVRHVVVGMGPHRTGNGIRRFQRMTGFRLVRLRVRCARPAAVRSPIRRSWAPRRS